MIFFDIGNVQLFFSHKKMIRNLALLYDISERKIIDFFSVDQLFEHWEKGEISASDIYKKLSLIKKPNYNDFLYALSNIFIPNSEIFPLIKKLKTHTKLAILSNISDAHYFFIKKHYSFISLFDYKLLSFEIGYRKPNEKIYRKALDLAEKENSPSFYIDDVNEYIQKAKKLGMDAVTYQSVGQLKKELFKRKFIC